MSPVYHKHHTSQTEHITTSHLSNCTKLATPPSLSICLSRRRHMCKRLWLPVVGQKWRSLLSSSSSHGSRSWSCTNLSLFSLCWPRVLQDFGIICYQRNAPTCTIEAGSLHPKVAFCGDGWASARILVAEGREREAGQRARNTTHDINILSRRWIYGYSGLLNVGVMSSKHPEAVPVMLSYMVQLRSLYEG